MSLLKYHQISQVKSETINTSSLESLLIKGGGEVRWSLPIFFQFST